MSLITISSENPDFSFVLQKNPVTTPITMRSLKYGTLFGFYSKKSPSTYVIYFRDGDDEVSYPDSPDEMFEYLNVTRYNSSMFIFHSIKELLGHLENNRYKDTAKDVAGFENTVMINMAHIGVPKYLEFFAKTVSGFDLQYQMLVGKEYRIIIKTKRSMHDMINYLSLLSMFLVLINENEYLFIDDSLVERYIKVMNNLDVEYYIRYLFKLRVINEKPSLFKKYMPELEKCSKQKIVFLDGDTHTQRIDFVSKNLDFKRNIVDVGCGEGRYTIPFSKKVDLIHAIDVDPEVRETLNHALKKKDINNVEVYSSMQEFKHIANTERVDVICSEVIEHLEFADVEKFLYDLFLIDAEKIIITTPNSDFNKFYALEGFRHLDHKFELNEFDFKNYMIDFVSKYAILKDFNFEFKGVGDSVDGIHVSQAIIFTRKK